MGAQRKEISFQLGQVVRGEGDTGAGKMKGTCLLKQEGKSRGSSRAGEARGDQTQKGLTESEPVRSLSTTEKPVGGYSSAWPSSVHDAPGTQVLGLLSF